MSIAACIIFPPQATERYEAARETVRSFLNAAHADEIVFTNGGTEAINLVRYVVSRAAHPAGRRNRAHR